MPQKTPYISDPDLPLQHRMFEELLLRLKGSTEALPTDPLDFLRYVGVTPWQDVGFPPELDKIAQVAQAVATEDQVVVEAGVGVGKSITVAALAAWYVCNHDPCAVVTLAPSHQHLKDVLWRHIRHLARKSQLPGIVFETASWNIHDKRFVVGLSPRKDKPEDLTVIRGYHSPNMLIIMDEGQGFNRLTYETVRSLATAENNTILVIGNPLGQSGPFWDICNSPLWKHIHISCLDHPNIILNTDAIPGATSRKWVQGYVSDHCARAGKGDAGAIEWPPGSGEWWQPDNVFQAQVMGIAPTESSDQLIPLAWVLGAMGWVAEPDNSEETIIGFDPSRVATGDMAAMILRRGPQVFCWLA